MTQVIVIRHGRTEWNRIERFRGRADLALDDMGMKQAKATAGRVAEWPVSAVYSSPLRRTLMTAQPIARQFELDVKPLDGIIDIDYGEWQGLSPEEANVRDGALYAKWQESPHMVKFPGGESLAEVRGRAALAVNKIIAQNSAETIAFVSHKVVCQLLILHFLEMDNSKFWQIGQDVSAVNVFQVGEDITYALLLNDTCHLKELT